MWKKVAAICIVIVVTATGIGIGYRLYDKETVYYEEWASDWGIALPEPAALRVVFDSKPRFHGDGEAYVIMDYNEQQLAKVKDLGFWQLITEDSIIALNGEISRFKHSVMEIYRDEQTKYEELYKNYFTEFGEGDLYYYQKKADGSYFINILNVDKGRLYVMEWMQ